LKPLEEVFLYTERIWRLYSPSALTLSVVEALKRAELVEEGLEDTALDLP
jgi:hypothetical protein